MTTIIRIALIALLVIIYVRSSYAITTFISKDGEFANYDDVGKLVLIEQGNLFNNMSTAVKQDESGNLEDVVIDKATPEFNNNYLFLQTSKLQTDKSDNNTIVLNAKTLSYIKTIEGLRQPFVISPDMKRIVDKDGRVYDYSAFKLLNDYSGINYTLPSGYSGPLFKISNVACFVGAELLYLDEIVFDLKDTPPTLVNFFTRPGRVRDCEAGSILKIKKGPDDSTELISYDSVTAKQISKIKIAGWDGVNPGEYLLTKDGKLIVRLVSNNDENDKLYRSGLLQIYSVATGSLIKEINLPLADKYDSGFLGYSKSGKYLYVLSVKTVYLIDMDEMSTYMTVDLPFTVISVISFQ